MSAADRDDEDRVPFHRPAIGDDELAAVCAVLRSGWLTTGAECAAFEREFGAAVGAGHAIAVILSGMLHDGTQGIRSVKRYGGRVLAQDPATARGTSMPSSAMATGCVDFVLPPHRLAPALIALAMAPGGASLLAVPAPHWAALSAS